MLTLEITICEKVQSALTTSKLTSDYVEMTLLCTTNNHIMFMKTVSAQVHLFYQEAPICSKVYSML